MGQFPRARKGFYGGVYHRNLKNVRAAVSRPYAVAKEPAETTGRDRGKHMDFKALFLDMDGTFLDFEAAERQAFYRALQKADVEPTAERCRLYSSINDSLWKAFERGEIAKEDIRRQRYVRLFDRLGVDADGGAVERDYEGFLGEGCDLLPDARNVLEYLHARYPLYVVTNGFAQVQRSRLRLAGIGELMRDSFISEELGAQKPKKAFFDRCFARMGGAFEPSEILLIGDSLTSDILGAKNAGLSSCWFNPKRLRNESGILPDREIHTLMELENFL